MTNKKATPSTETIDLGAVVSINPDSVGKDFRFETVKYIDITSVGSGTLNGLSEIKFSQAPSRAKRLVNNGDTILSTVRPNRRSFLYVKNPELNIVVSTGFAVLRATDKIDSRYLYYTVTHQAFTDYLTNNAKGAAYPAVDADTIGRAEIWLPPLPTQHKIAGILSTYDDLIENNLRRIKILEEMARLMYREWFVNFRFPGHEKVKMVDSELGMIPEGWEVRPLASLLIGHIGGGWGKDIEEERHTEAAWVIRGTDIPNAHYCDFSKVPYRYHTASNLRSRRLKPGDIVFEVSGGSKGQPLGRALYVSVELLLAFRGDSVICASFCKRIQPDTEKYASELLYLSFLEAYESGEIEQFQVQSTGISNFKWSDYISQVNRCVPSIALQEHFRDLVAPLFSEISTLGHKNTTLRHTRDLLLPKLISGELDISELDINTGEELA